MKMYRQNFGFNNFNKKILLSVFAVYIFFFVFFLSIGFSAFEMELVMRDITAEVKYWEGDARVISFKATDQVSGGARASNTDYNYNRIYGDITLPNANSSVTYEVQVINLGGAKVGISSMTGLDSNLSYTLTDYSIGQPILDDTGQYNLGSVMTFYITIEYAENATTLTAEQPFYLIFDFRRFYSVTYHGVPGDEEFPREVMASTNLVLNTELTSIDRLKVTENTAFLTYGDDYMYDEATNTLTIFDVQGDLLLSYRDIAYLANLSSKTAFYKEFSSTIQNAYFVDHVNYPSVEEGRVGLYENMSETGVEGGIVGWVVTNSNGMHDLYIGSIYDIYTKNFENAFAYMTNLKSISFKNLNTSESVSFAYTFYRTAITSLDLSTFNTQSAISMADMFGDMTALETLDVRHFNTENVENMFYMFGGMTKIKNLDIASFKTTKAVTMDYMFSGMNALENINFGDGFTCSAATSMSYMFNGASKLQTLDLSNFNTKNLRYTQYMFNNCDALLSLDVSYLDTSKVTDMSYMFNSMNKLESIKFGGLFDTSSVTNMNNMFSSCPKLTSLDLSTFRTPLVGTMENMFKSMGALTSLDISNFTLGMTYNMNNFMQYCSQLRHIDFRSASFTSVSNSSSMFASVPATVEIIVLDEAAEAWIQNKLGAGVGTIIIANPPDTGGDDTGDTGEESGGDTGSEGGTDTGTEDTGTEGETTT